MQYIYMNLLTSILVVFATNTTLNPNLSEILSSYLKKDSILLLYDCDVNISLLDMFIKTTSTKFSVLLFCNHTKLIKKDHPYIKRTKNTVFLETNINLASKNAFHHSQSQILCVGDSKPNIETCLQANWNLTRSWNVAGIELPKELLYKRLPDNGCSNWKLEYLGIESLKTFAKPNKPPKNFLGCPLYETNNPINPFVANDKDGFGVDTELIKTIVKKLNYTLVYVTDPDGESIYDVSTNDDDLKGCVKQLNNHKIDICYGGLYATWHPPHQVDYCHSHHAGTLVWFGPIPKEISSIHNIYLGFSKEVWIAVTLATLSYILFSVFYERTLQSGRPSGTVTMSIISAALNSTSAPPSTWLARVMLVIFYIYTLHITSVYQSMLTSFQSKTPTEKPIRTIEDALDADLEMIAFHGHREFILNSYQAAMRRMMQEKKYYITETTEEYVAKGVMDPANVHLGDFLTGTMLVATVRVPHNVLKPPFTTAYMNILFAPDSALTHLFDELVLHLVEGGFIDEWIAKAMPPQITIGGKGPKPLKLESLTGIFFILLAANIAAAIIFVIEIMGKVLCVRRPSKEDSRDPKVIRSDI